MTARLETARAPSVEPELQKMTQSMPMTAAYEEVIDFIAQGHGPARLIAFRPSEAARQRIAALIEREKADGLAADELAELDHYLDLEHLMRLAKARARQYVGDA